MIDTARAIRMYRQSLNNANKSNRAYAGHCFKIVRVLKGAAAWNIAGAMRSVGRDTVILLNNEEKRRFVSIDECEDLELYVVEIEPPFLYDTGLLPLFTKTVDGYAHRIVKADDKLLRLLNQIDSESQEPDGYSPVMVASCVTQLLALVARMIALPAAPGPVVSPGMKAALAHIDKHYTQRIGLNELAAIAHMSPSSFSKAFTKLNGIGPAQYIKRKRIGHAIQLLEGTDRTVIDIAMDCGFANISNFYKAFHSLTRQSPKEYRPRSVQERPPQR